MIQVLVAYMCVVAVLSSIAFALYGLDKRRAGTGCYRISERTLHLIAFLGGWPGALLGQRHFRHKTQKPVFLAVFWFTVVAHLAIVGTATYVWR
jgi:uncharacterized membrane protein YsdA (DUF1294 family)